MRLSLKDCLHLFHRAKEELNQLDETPQVVENRALAFAKLLHSLWPTATLSGCLLWEDQQPVLSLVNEQGEPRNGVALPDRSCPPWENADPLKSVMAQLNGTLEEDRIVVREIAYPQGEHGALFVAVPKKSAADRILAVTALLNLCADTCMLSVRLRACCSLKEELARQRRVANLSEVAGPVIHEFNNFLYSLLLHLSVLEQELPENMRSEIETLQRQGKQMAAVIRSLQQYRQETKTLPHPINLIVLLLDTLRDLPEEVGRPVSCSFGPANQGEAPEKGVELRLDLAPNLPTWRGDVLQCKRLYAFLLKNSVGACGERGLVTIASTSTETHLFFRFQDSGPGVADDLRDHVLEPQGPTRPGTNNLELAACKSMARRLGGSLQVEAAPRGLMFVLKLPVAW